MKCMKTILAFAMICSLMAFGGTALAADGATAEPWFVEGVNKEEMILEPGTTGFCNKDLTVQNMSKEDMATVQIIRGNGDNYDWDQLNPNETLAYKKSGVSIFSGAPGSSQSVEDIRIINGTMGTAKLKVLCK